jgi:hypothetical protein
MLKRNIAILIAGGLFSAQAGLAVAENSSWVLLPGQAQYFAGREAANPNPIGAKGPLPASSTSTQFTLLPAQAKYFAERAARNPNPTGAPGGAAGPCGIMVSAYSD